VKLSGVLGMFLGWLGTPAFAAGLAAPFVLAISGTALIWAGAATGHSRIAFGLFMVSAAAAVVLVSLLQCLGSRDIFPGAVASERHMPLKRESGITFWAAQTIRRTVQVIRAHRSSGCLG
jgi:hypothetical protein